MPIACTAYDETNCTELLCVGCLDDSLFQGNGRSVIETENFFEKAFALLIFATLHF